METNYLQLLNFIRQEASGAYQERVPEATRTNITEVGNAITTYTPTQNEFLDALINKIGLTLVNSTGYTNPFAPFKGEQINYGDTIEDIFVELPKGVKFEHIEHGESIDPYKVTKPSVKVLYHKIDREVQYTVTIWDDMLKRAFKSPQGMNSLVDQITQSLYEAMTVDEFTYAKNLLSNEAKVYGHVEDLGEVETQYELASKLLGQIKIVASNMKFKRKDYNVLEVETMTPPEEIVVVLRNDMKEAIDLQVLAGVFNLDKVELSQRVIEVDSFDDVEMLGCVLDARGFRIHDALKDAESQRNSRGRYTNYFVNHWGLVSWSKYRNAVLFKGTVEEETE